jgi:large repetitive protein
LLFALKVIYFKGNPPTAAMLAKRFNFPRLFAALLCLCALFPLLRLQLNAQPQPGTVLWTYDLGSPATSPALGTNGTVYIGTVSGLYAVTNSGSAASNKWVFSVPVHTPAAIGNDGTIYFGDDNASASFYALNPDGTQKWVLPLNPGNSVPFQSSPLVGYDGTLYFVARGALYAVAASGAKKWQYPVDEGFTGATLSPTSGSDGTVYVTSFYDRTAYAVNPDGTLKWSSSTLAEVMGESPAIALDGTIYVTAGSLYAFNRDGTNLWTSATDAYHGSPVIAKDGTIYVGTQDFGLSAFTSNGDLKWHALPSPELSQPAGRAAPALDSAGNIYYCTSNALWRLDSQGQVQWSVAGMPPEPGVSPNTESPVIGPDGTIYAYLRSKLYAIAGTNALADSPWPMYRANPRHTGKKEAPVLQKPQKRSDANFQFQLYSDLGRTNTVQTSMDLTTWTSLTNIVITNLPMDFIDLTATNSPARFYRAIQQ